MGKNDQENYPERKRTHALKPLKEKPKVRKAKKQKSAWELLPPSA